MASCCDINASTRAQTQIRNGGAWIGKMAKQEYCQPKTETSRAHRTWIERLWLWERAYETKIWASGHEVSGRGPTAEASQEAAMNRWNREVAQDNVGSP